MSSKETCVSGFDSHLCYVSDLTDDPDTEKIAQLRRELVTVVNTRWRFDALMVKSLILFAVSKYGVVIVDHPSFPNGVVFAWAAANGVNLDNYEKSKRKGAESST